MSNPENKKQEEISLKKLLLNLFDHWKLVLGCFLFSLVLAVIYLVFYPTTYEFMSRIQIREDETSASAGLPIGGGDMAGLMQTFGMGSLGGSINMDDERKFFTTYELLKDVVEETKIQVEYTRPYSFIKLYGQTPFTVCYSPKNDKPLMKAPKFIVKKKKDGSFVVTKKVKKGRTEKFAFKQLPATITTDEGQFDFATDGTVEETSYTYHVKVSPAGWIAEDLMDEIGVDVAAKNSYIVELLIQDHDLARGCDVLNSLMKHYNERISGFRNRDAKKQLAYLDEKIEETKQILLNDEALIEQFKASHKMTMLEADVKMMADGLVTLNEKIIEVESNRHITSLLKEYINNPANKFELVPALYSPTEGEQKSTIANYNETLLERNRLKNLSKTDKNPMINSLEKQLETLRANVNAMIDNSDQSLQLALQDLKAKESDFMKKIKDVPQQERRFVDLKRNQEINQAIYLILVQKRENVQMSMDESKDRGRIVDAAYIKQKPVAPRKLFAALGIIAFTLLIPLLIMMVTKEIREFLAEYKKRRG